MYRYRRVKTLAEGMECYLIEKFSDRVVSKPKTSLTLEDDGNANFMFILHTTANPYEYKISNTEGNFMTSVYGTLRWQAESDSRSQVWQLVLEEDGYYRIENADDKRCLSVSGNSTIAGTNIFLTEASKTIHQSFAFYFDSEVHNDYQEADIFSKAYKEENLRKIKEQSEWTSGIHFSPISSQPVQEIYDMSGRKIVNEQEVRGIVIVNGRKMMKP